MNKDIYIIHFVKMVLFIYRKANNLPNNTSTSSYNGNKFKEQSHNQ